MRLIDADEAVNIINAYDDRGLTLDEVIRVTNGIAREIEAMPTADAVPVVRCEKCKHHKGLNAMEKFEYGSNVVWCNIPHFGGVLMKNDAFCSYGDCKDGE